MSLPLDLPGLGTLLAITGPIYEVRVASGAIHGYTSPSGTPSEEIAAAEIAWAIAHPPAFPVSPEQVWAEKLAGVITVAPMGIAIKADIRTRGLMGDTLNFLREAEIAERVTASTPQRFWDANGVEHSLTVAELRAVILSYGAQWQAMFAEFAP